MRNELFSDDSFAEERNSMELAWAAHKRAREELDGLSCYGDDEDYSGHDYNALGGHDDYLFLTPEEEEEEIVRQASRCYKKVAWEMRETEAAYQRREAYLLMQWYMQGRLLGPNLELLCLDTDE